jgi:hypothetical protein
MKLILFSLLIALLSSDPSVPTIKIDTKRNDAIKLSQIAERVRKIPLNSILGIITSSTYTNDYLFMSTAYAVAQFSSSGQLLRTLETEEHLSSFCIDEAGRRLFLFSDSNAGKEASVLTVYDFLGQQQGVYKIIHTPVASIYFKGKLYMVSGEFHENPYWTKYRVSTLDTRTGQEQFLPFEYVDDSFEKAAVSSYTNFFVRNGVLNFSIACNKQSYQIENDKVSTALIWKLTNLKKEEKEGFNVFSPCISAGNCLMITYSVMPPSSSDDSRARRYTYITTPQGDTYNVEYKEHGYLYDDLNSHRHVMFRQIVGRDEFFYIQDDKNFCIIELKE